MLASYGLILNFFGGGNRGAEISLGPRPPCPPGTAPERETHEPKELGTVTIFTIPNGYSRIDTTHRIVSEQTIIPVCAGTGSTMVA